MIVAINGRFVPEEQAVVSVFDRSFLYGDGLFETMRLLHGRPFRWDQHLERLERGAQFLKLRLPLTANQFQDYARQLIEQNRITDALLRLTISRGVGLRGYSPQGANNPSWVMSLHPAPPAHSPAPEPWKLVTSNFKLPAGEAVAQFKTCNKLSQILARTEADEAGAQEALLLNTDGHVVEATSSNLFWVDGECICTPPVASGVLAGITRLVVFELTNQLGLKTAESRVTPEQLRQMAGVFLSLSSIGIAEASSLDSKPLHRSPLVPKLRTAYWEILEKETTSDR